jgi:hypothetical protein
MKADVLRTNLIDKIEHADDSQVKEIYGWVSNYLGQSTEEGWHTLSELHQDLILQGLKEADAGLCVSFDEATQKLKDKYGLND